MMSEEKAEYKAAAEPMVEQVRVELPTGAMLAVSMIRQVSGSCRAPVPIKASEARSIEQAIKGLEIGGRP